MPKAMILAAGFGKRLMHFTDNLPKALVPLAGEPMIRHVIRRLEYYGYNEIIVNLHHHAGKLRDYLSQIHAPEISIVFSDESNRLLDTGGGIAKASWFFEEDEPFLVHNCDVISLVPLDKMMEFHIRNHSIATLAVSDRKTSRPLAFSNEGLLLGRWTAEAGTIACPLAFSGISILNPCVIAYKPSQEVFSLIEMLINASPYERIMAYEHDPGIWADAGNINNFSRAEHLIKNAHL